MSTYRIQNSTQTTDPTITVQARGNEEGEPSRVSYHIVSNRIEIVSVIRVRNCSYSHMVSLVSKSNRNVCRCRAIRKSESEGEGEATEREGRRGGTHEAVAAAQLTHEMRAHHVNARLEAPVQLAQIVERYERYADMLFYAMN